MTGLIDEENLVEWVAIETNSAAICTFFGQREDAPRTDGRLWVPTFLPE